MTKAQHTPGPWCLDIGSDGAVVYLQDAATVANIPDTLKGFDANARLIAAAPELLEALISARNWLNEAGYARPVLECDAAIKKATADV